MKIRFCRVLKHTRDISLTLIGFGLVLLAQGVQAQTSKPDATAQCAQDWARIQNSEDPDDFDDFVDLFPDCEQVKDAEQRIKDLTGEGSTRGSTAHGSGKARDHMGAVGQAPSPSDEIKPFGPIPKWSTAQKLPPYARQSFVKSLNTASPSLYDVGDRLQELLVQAHYTGCGFYSTEGGFALVARIEKINDDGTRSKEDISGATSPLDTQPFGFAGFLASLIKGPEGYYRVFVFMVTDVPLTNDGKQPTVETSEAWFSNAATSLPASYRNLPFTNNHNITVLVYEFKKGTGHEKTSVVPVNLLTWERHLKGAGLYRPLGLGAN